MATPPTASGARRLLRRMREIMADPGSAQGRLDKVVALIATNMVAEVCSCYLRRAGEVLELFATQGLKPDAVHRTRLRIGEGLVGDIAAYRRPLNLADAQSHPLFAYREETGEEIYKSLLGVPILQAGRTLGVLVVQNRTLRQYDDEEVEALEIVAMVLAELVAGGELVDPTELSDVPSITGPQVLEGLGIVGGLAMGEVVIHSQGIEVTKIVAEDPEQELERLALAVAGLRADVDRLLSAPDLAGEGDHREVLETYGMFARDSGWLNRIEEAIKTGITAEAAVVRVQEENRRRITQLGNSYLRERLMDLDDLSARLLKHLTGGQSPATLAALPDDCILVARSMGPAEFVDYDRERVRGLILEEGSLTTHVAIMARAFRIPMIGRVRGAMERFHKGDQVLMDGRNGQIVIRPDENLVQAYYEQIAARDARRALYETLRHKKVVTKDGIDIALFLNAGLPVDVSHLDLTGADGVGLYRTEIPMMLSPRYPGVNEQVDIYADIMERAGDKPVVFRTLDIGGDKPLPSLPQIPEENPAMGWRAIRIGLDMPSILRQQLRALIRAAAGKPLSIMFPMVTTVAEFADARDLLDRELSRVRAGGDPVPERVSVGAMVEVPALVWQLDELLPQVDFLSVGTNDLLQFFFASDRGNTRLAGRYDLLHGSVLSMLREIVAACDSAGKPLTVCGEAAGEPLQAMTLIGVGVRRLSMSPARIGAIKLMTQNLDVGLLKEYLAFMEKNWSSDLRRALLNFVKDHNIDV